MDIFELSGSFEARPTSSTPISDPSDIFARKLAASLLLKGKLSTRYDLAADGVQAVSLGGLAGAHVVMVSAPSRVLVRLTSVEGATQALPVDGLLVLVSESEPFTAIDLTRPAGVATTVQVFLGEKF